MGARAGGDQSGDHRGDARGWRGSRTGRVPPRPIISARPALTSGFDWNSHDYAIRAHGKPVTLRVRVPRGWQARLNDGTWHSHPVERETTETAGRGLRVQFRRTPSASNPHLRSFCVRFLPRDFPKSSFARLRPGGPARFAVALGDCAAIFSRNGTPVWWYKPAVAPIDVEPLGDGTIAESSFGADAPWVIYRPNGHLVRKVDAVNGSTDFHDIQLLPTATTCSAPASPAPGWTPVSSAAARTPRSTTPRSRR